MMLFGQIACAAQCPLLGVEWTSLFAAHMSAYDPNWTCVPTRPQPIALSFRSQATNVSAT